MNISNRHCPVLLLTALFTFFSMQLTMANDAPIKLMSGNATPLDVFFGLPKGTKVQMVSEVVKISLGDTSYTVDATFHFFNPSTKTENITVGFPKRSEGQLDSSDEKAVFVDDFISFESWVNNNKVEVKEIPGRSSIEATLPLSKMLETIKTPKPGVPFEGMMIGRDSRWLVKDVAFAPNSKTTTRVRYAAKYQDIGCQAARYIYGTGAYWNGNIGTSIFIITCNVSAGNDMCWDQIQNNSTAPKYKYTRHKQKDNTVRYELLNYKPGENDQIFMTVGCPE